MDDEIKKLNPEVLKKASGGEIPMNSQTFGTDIVEIGNSNKLQERAFAATGICPRCGKIFASQSEIAGHIKAWAAGQQ